MEGYLFGTADTTNLRHRLDGTNLVVGIHDRDKHCLIGNRTSHVVRVHTRVAIDGYIGCLEAKPFQVLAGMQHGMMLYRRGDKLVAFLLRGKGNAIDGEVIALRPTTREGDF